MCQLKLQIYHVLFGIKQKSFGFGIRNNLKYWNRIMCFIDYIITHTYKQFTARSYNTNYLYLQVL